MSLPGRCASCRDRLFCVRLCQSHTQSLTPPAQDTATVAVVVVVVVAAVV